ncbi:MAG: DUF1698 domain-containing protein [Nevskia sp.]|nr:DUF1698 domain-containing protein [Nevskia sp.]
MIDPSVRLPHLELPVDLRGKTVLDVGAWDGFFSFEAERRGAARVLATDSFSWSGEGWGRKACFELAREVLGSRVEDRQIGVLELGPERVGRFDLVLFLNVLYHMPHPLLALERVASVTAGTLILETHLNLTDVATPAIAFYPDGEMWGDKTTYCGPNLPALLGMLKFVGFDQVRVVSMSSPTWLRARALALHAAKGIPMQETLRQKWAVVHAWCGARTDARA